MYNWRVTKFNPAFRSTSGAYLLEDWTSFHDIGKSFQGTRLTLDQYLRVEDAYIAAILSFCVDANVGSLTAVDVEIFDTEECDNAPDEWPQNGPSNLRDGMVLYLSDLPTAIRLALREFMWCKLEYDSRFYVHFGYDYYMYVGSDLPCPRAIDETVRHGLFVETYPSPYNQPI